MKFIIYICSIFIMVVSLTAVGLCVKKLKGENTIAFLPAIIYLGMAELMLIICYLVTYDLFHVENFGAALLYFQTFGTPMALVSLQTLNPSTSKKSKILISLFILGAFNMLYFCFDILYSPWWAYCIIIDLMAVATSCMFPISTKKAIFFECSLAMYFLVRAMTDDYYDYLRDDADVYILISSFTILVYSYFMHRRHAIARERSAVSCDSQ